MMLTKRRIAVLIAGLEATSQKQLAFGMSTRAAELGYDLCFFNSLGSTDSTVERFETSECEIYGLPDLSTFCGAVVLYATINNSVARETTRKLLSRFPRLPVVSFDYPLEDAVNVTCDDRASLLELLAHLTDDHHVRRLAFVSGPADNAVAQNRLSTFRQFLRERCIPLPTAYVQYGDFIREGGLRAAEHFCAGSDPIPEAIVCANDDMALGLMEGLSSHGYQVPKDVLVTGFDATDEALSHHPSLTSIFRPLDKSGSHLITLIDQMLSGMKPEPSVLLPTEIYFGQSCGCKRTGVGSDVSRQAQLYRELQESEHNMIRTSRLSNALSAISSYDDLAAQLESFVRDNGLSEMYVCIDQKRMQTKPKIRIKTQADQAVESALENQPESKAGYGENMEMIFGFRDGKVLPTVCLPTSLLLPIYAEKERDASRLVFCPLYHRNKNFGYVAFDLRQASGFILYAVLVILGGALESLSQQGTIHAYAHALEQSIIHDPMTGLLNRRGWQEVSRKMYERASSEQRELMVISADVNGLKSINDHYGHMEGDFAIQLAAKAIATAEDEDTVCIHLSGDEFMIAAVGKTEVQMQELIARVKSTLAKLNTLTGKPYVTSLSLGGSVEVPNPLSSLEDFICQADDHMYIEKKEQKRRAALIMAKESTGGATLSEVLALQKATDRNCGELLRANLCVGTVGLMQDAACSLCYISPLLLETLGYTSKRFRTQVDGQYVQCIDPADRAAVLRHYATLSAGGDVVRQCYRLLRQDGSQMWVMELSTVTPLSPGRNVINCVLVDISTHMDTRQELELCRRHLELAVAQSDMPMFDYDVMADTLRFSPTACERFDLPRLQEHFTDAPEDVGLYHFRSHQALGELMKSLRAGEPSAECDVCLIDSNGEARRCRLSASALRSEEGALLFVVGTISEIV